MVVWNTEVLMRWVICRQQDIEETVESSLANITNIANLHDVIKVPWRWLPQGMSVSGKPNCKLFAKDIVVGHCSEGAIMNDLRSSEHE